MRTRSFAAATGLAALLVLGGCSFTIDPESVKPPVTGPPACVPACTGKACGNSDGCTGTCQPGSGCVTGATTHRVDGAVTHGAVQSGGASHQIRGTVDLGSASPEPSSTNHRIEQGSLR
jgi:hypothetical protein